MEIYNKHFTIPSGTDINIYFIGDVHEGSSNFAEEEFKKAVRIIEKDENAYWIGMGDYIEAINVNDKRFNPVSIAKKYEIRDLKDLPYKQMEAFFKNIKPIQNKCLALLIGNHEETLIRYTYNDIYDRLIDMFEVKPAKLGYTGFATIGINRTENNNEHSRYKVVISLNHGDAGLGKLPGYPINKAHELFRWMDADVNIVGHLHKLVEDSKKFITLDKRTNKIKRQRKYYGVSGCFLYTYKEGTRSYSEHKGWVESDIGMLKLNIHTRNDGLDLSLNKIILG